MMRRANAREASITAATNNNRRSSVCRDHSLLTYALALALSFYTE